MTVTLRATGPGDLGWIIPRRGELYAAEEGYGEMVLWTQANLLPARRLKL
nr:hypothetical protein [uncultured Caulobacter sp.]